MSPPKAVRNSDLRAELLPSCRSSWEQLFRFALTFDGYAAFGGVEQLAELQSSRRSETMSILRGRLFFLQRQMRHQGQDPTELDRAEFLEILEQIRSRVQLANELLL